MSTKTKTEVTSEAPAVESNEALLARIAELEKQLAAKPGPLKADFSEQKEAAEKAGFTAREVYPAQKGASPALRTDH